MGKDLVEEFKQMNAGGVGYLVTPENCDVARKWRHFFRYENGELYWRNPRGPRAKAGVPVGSILYHGYRKVTFQGKVFSVHRIIWEMFNGEIDDRSGVIDHINRVKSDNRIENLRLVSKSDNAKNADRSDRSKHGIHVYKDTRRKRDDIWFSIVTINKKQVHSGYFYTKEEAIAWRNKMTGKVGDA